MTKKILLSPPVFAETESKNILSALSQEQISTYGNFISKFEEGLRGYSKGYQTAATNSGTSALHLAMRLLGVGSGDEVVCQSFTFCATANPVCYQGAMPVFVDSERETWNIDPNALEEAIEDRMLKGKKPKAIVVVDLYGMPASYDDILSISNRFEIPLVEDAAEALGSTYKGQSCSSFGAFGVFSFNGNKIITTGSGGCLVSPDANAIEQARYLSLQAKDQVHFYRHQEIGYNYYMNNLSAAVGLAQLERLPEKIGKRRAIFSRYVEMLGDCNGISCRE